MDPSKRFVTIVLAAGILVLGLAILIGEQMGDRVMVSAATGPRTQEIIVTPLPAATAGPYGGDWKRSQALAAAPDPRFPDPRVPPVPLPTPIPKPSVQAVKASPTPTINPNLPIWDQRTLAPSPSASPSAAASSVPSAAPSAQPSPGPSESPKPRATP